MDVFRAGFCICLASMLFAVQPARAGIPSIQEFGRNIPGLVYPGFGGFAVADFDGDGKEDVVIPASNGSAMFVVIGRTQTGIGIKQSVLFPDGYLTRVFVCEVEGAPHLFVLNQGVLREFSGWPLRQVHSIDIGTTGFPAMAVGDIDADGRLEVVVADSDQEGLVRAYDLASGTLRWSLPKMHATSIQLLQLDADPALEIVLDGHPVRVIDGATQATDWSYEDFYIARGLAGGKFRQGGGMQFVFAFGAMLRAFQSEPFAPIWGAPTEGVGALGAADLDRDGFDEIIQGDQQWGAVNVYDVGSDQSRLRIPHSARGTVAVAGVDLNGEGPLAIAFSPADATDSEHEIFRLVGGVTGAPLWEWSNAEPGANAPVVLGDLGNGSRKLVYASQGSTHVTGVISQLDAATGTREWRSPPERPTFIGTYSFRPTALQLVRRKDEAPIIAAAGANFGGHLVAIDARSHEVLWHITAEGPLKDRWVSQAVAFDSNDDGDDEIATCTRHSYDNNVRLSMFSGRRGELLWESPDIRVGIGGESCRGIAAGRFEPSRNPVVVALLPDSIVAFDSLTQERAWTLPSVADGLSLLEQGEHGREFVTFAGSTLRFYDATMRVLRRQFDLDAPVLAVRQLARDIHRLAVAAGDRLLIVDGVSGDVLASSEFLGVGLGDGNHLAVEDLGGGSWLIAAGSQAGVFRLFARLTDAMFRDGFDAR